MNKLVKKADIPSHNLFLQMIIVGLTLLAPVTLKRGVFQYNFFLNHYYYLLIFLVLQPKYITCIYNTYCQYSAKNVHFWFFLLYLKSLPMPQSILTVQSFIYSIMITGCPYTPYLYNTMIIDCAYTRDLYHNVYRLPLHPIPIYHTIVIDCPYTPSLHHTIVIDCPYTTFLYHHDYRLPLHITSISSWL